MNQPHTHTHKVQFAQLRGTAIGKQLKQIHSEKRFPAFLSWWVQPRIWQLIWPVLYQTPETSDLPTSWPCLAFDTPVSGDSLETQVTYCPSIPPPNPAVETWRD